MLKNLTRARALIADPKNWTQGVSARNRKGDPVGPKDWTACQYCAAGAVVRTGGQPAAFKALDNAARALHPGSFSVICVNDEHGHEAVLKVFDKAIGEINA